MTLRLAIIGTGKVSREEYIPYLATQPDVELAYWNRTAKAAQETAAKFGGQVLASLDAVAPWKPTAALVLTSERARFEVSNKLVESGIPRLFFEKPLVAARGQADVGEDDFANAQALLTLAEARECQTAMVFNYRFFDQTIAAKKALQTRYFGELTNVAAQVHFACWSHCIDLIHFFGGDFVEITALAGSVSHKSPELASEAHDVTAAFRLANGATGTLIGTMAMKWQQPLYELIFTFENGRIHMRDLDGTLEILDGASQVHESLSLVRHTSRWDRYSASFKKALEAYLQSLRDGTPPPVPGIDGLRELQVEAALRRSIAQKRPVNVQEEFPISTAT